MRGNVLPARTFTHSHFHTLTLILLPMIQRISILGCGWLGLPLGAALVQKGYEVKGSTTRPEKLEQIREQGIEPYLIKVGDAVEGPEKESFFDAGLLVLNIPPGGRHNPEVEEQYPQKVKAIMEHIHSGAIEYLIFVSSTSVYGDENREVTEADKLGPATPSARALVVIERYLALLKRPQTTVLRMGGLVGGGRQPGRFLAGKKDVGNGEAPVNLVHLDDCIGVIEAVVKQNAWDETFNVCADQHPTRAAFYTAQAKKQGFEPPTFRASDQLAYKIVSNEKLKKALGYAFKHPDPMGF